jgi:hypothetical protein
VWLEQIDCSPSTIRHGDESLTIELRDFTAETIISFGPYVVYVHVFDCSELI